MICPKCQFNNPDTADFCQKCGHSLVSGMCPKCQFKNPDTAGFCQKCGHSLIPGDIETIEPIIRKKINPHLYAIPLWGGFGVVIFGAFLSNAPQGSAVGELLLGVGAISILYAVTYGYIALYRSWAIIQGRTARTTPGRAVGFNFIPFYNFYWIFVAVKGLAEDINSLFDQANLNAKRISVGLSLWMCILYILSIVPVIGVIALFISTILYTILIYQWAEAVNSNVLDEVYERTDIVFKPIRTTGGAGTAAIVIGVIFGGIVIVGILAAIAIPQFAAYKNAANDGITRSQLRNLAVAMEAYYVQNGNYGDPNGKGHTVKETSITKGGHGYTSNPKVIITIPSVVAPCAYGKEGSECWSADAAYAGSRTTFTWNADLGGMQPYN